MDAASQGRIEDGAHYLPARVYYEDTDFSGAVYHANYLKFFERGRTEFLRLIGISHTELSQGQQPCAFAVTKLTVEYLRAAMMDDALVVRSRFTALRGVRIQMEQELLREGATICTASVEIVCITPSQTGAGSARRPPADVLAALKAHTKP